MKSNKNQTELERLRGEIMALKEDQDKLRPEESGGEQRSILPTNTASTGNGNGHSSPIEDEELSDVASLLEELVDTLEHELKDTNPITLLVIFGLGVLIGRLLPR